PTAGSEPVCTPIWSGPSFRRWRKAPGLPPRRSGRADRNLSCSCCTNADGSRHTDRHRHRRPVCDRRALIIGRFCSGWLIDRAFGPYVAMIVLAIPMFGIAVLGFGLGGISPIVGTICLGMGIGAEIDIMAFLVGRSFGLRQYGTLYGVMFAIAILGN